MVYSLNRLFSSCFFSYPEYSRSGSMFKPEEPKMARRGRGFYLTPNAVVGKMDYQHMRKTGK